MLAGFMNPIFYLFDIEKADQGELDARYKLPYADSQYPEIAEKMIAEGDALEHGHSLDDQLGGQVDAGFAIIGFYEDKMRNTIISEYTPTYIATRAIKR